ncbi:DUF1579 family protein [Tahibacter amnicola]|uniref:DUF1579 family protein n=1 Tax=Tahibacter amnicola TaxID=2976241 RepID=A0ABY6BDM6_9GAMM|nr:DUF1579 family protein [Tahibacter amnicola]UXI68138.1 DUF1579 family protein [Tahibacter amnicola]
MKVIYSVFLAFAASAAVAAEAPPPKPCTAPAYRQFDFWLGEWDVFNPAGKHVGKNRIESILNGCGVAEHWTGDTGVRGTSYNAYDQRHGHWNQYWVSDDADVLWLTGSAEGKGMLLSGEQPDPQSGKPVRHRVRWTPQDDGSVRQVWESSSDAGKSWNTVFEGLYRRAGKSG